MKNTKTRALVESAILIALATILSLIKLVDLPYGGSITIASMFPIVILSYRFGLRWGCAAGLVYGIIQQLTGLSSLSYVTTWQSIVAVILLDYVIAYAVTGLGGIFRGRIKTSLQRWRQAPCSSACSDTPAMFCPAPPYGRVSPFRPRRR